MSVTKCMSATQGSLENVVVKPSKQTMFGPPFALLAAMESNFVLTATFRISVSAWLLLGGNGNILGEGGHDW